MSGLSPLPPIPPRGWVLLSTVPAASAATADVETGFGSTYDDYAIVLGNVLPATVGSNLRALLKIGGSYLTTATYRWNLLEGSAQSAGITVEQPGGSGTFIQLSGFVDNNAIRALNGVLMLANVNSTAAGKQGNGQISFGDSGSAYWNVCAGFNNSETAVLRGMRFQFSAGNIATGTFKLYGITKT